jgi:hypothetical protein
MQLVKCVSVANGVFVYLAAIDSWQFAMNDSWQDLYGKTNGMAHGTSGISATKSL